MTTMAISLAMGLHATHMFVPPTPGPLAVAGILNADLGMVILFGALVSILSCWWLFRLSGRRQALLLHPAG